MFKTFNQLVKARRRIVQPILGAQIFVDVKMASSMNPMASHNIKQLLINYFL